MAEAQDVNGYLHHLMKQRGFAVPTVNGYAAALRLFFTVTVDGPWEQERMAPSLFR